jgi:hypothetical protein
VLTISVTDAPSFFAAANRVKGFSAAVLNKG